MKKISLLEALKSGKIRLAESVHVVRFRELRGALGLRRIDTARAPIPGEGRLDECHEP